MGSALASDLSQPLGASPPASLTPQQTLYKQTYQAIQNGDRKAYWQAQNQLEYYPLLPYLKRAYMQKFMRSLPATVVEQYLNDYSQDPFIKTIQFRYLAYLSTRAPQKFAQWYQKTPTDWLNASLHCRYLRGFSRNKTKLMRYDSLINSLWQKPSSQVEICDAVFARWRSYGGLTQDRVLARIKLVAKQGHPKFIAYLTTLLTKDNQYLGRLWGQVANSSAYITRTSYWEKADKFNQQAIVMFGMERLIWRNVDVALNNIKIISDKASLTAAQLFHLYKTLAIRLALLQDERAEYWLAAAAELDMREDLRDWTVSYWIQQKDWTALQSFVETLSLDWQNDGRTRYWSATALHKTGNHKQANDILKNLAQTRSYYGFLASDALELPIQLNHQSIVIPAEHFSLIENDKAFQAAFELLAVGQLHWARSKWQAFLSGLPVAVGKSAGVIAAQRGWHDRAVYAMAEFGALTETQIRFPIVYQDAFFSAAKNYQQAPSWLLAVARRESAFVPDARSTANAFGIMQVLPSTASYIAQRDVSRVELKDPKKNIALGAQYLDYLSGKVSANQVLRTAAYNAGWRRVLEWLPEEPVTAVSWIESIPFKETRAYVKAVIAYERIYAKRLASNGEIIPSSFADLSQMMISQDTLTTQEQGGKLAQR